MDHGGKIKSATWFKSWILDYQGITYVHKCNTLKEMCDTFEMIYEDSNEIKREIMKKLDLRGKNTKEL